MIREEFRLNCKFHSIKEKLLWGRFTLPRDLYFGKGSLETLKTLKGKKAVLCLGGGSMKRFGFCGSGCGIPEGSRH